MGLDSVELVMRMEEEFGIDIPDQEAVRMQTPRDVIAYVCARLGVRDGPPCLTRRAFHRLRGALVAVVGVERRAVRPNTRLAEFFPREGRWRKEAWWELEARLGAARWPALVRPGWVFLAVLALGLVAAAAVLFRGGGYAGGALDWTVAATAFAAVGYAGRHATRHLRHDLPDEVATVAELSRYLASVSPPEEDPEAWTRERVALTVRRVTLGFVAPEDYREDASFVRDMGID